MDDAQTIEHRAKRTGTEVVWTLHHDGDACRWVLAIDHSGRHRPRYVDWHFAQPTTVDPDGSVCDVIPAGRCYGDFGCLVADQVYAAWLEQGEPAVWEMLADLLARYPRQATFG